jgi:hypothetical protein
MVLNLTIQLQPKTEIKITSKISPRPINIKVTLSMWVRACLATVTAKWITNNANLWKRPSRMNNIIYKTNQVSNQYNSIIRILLLLPEQEVTHLPLVKTILSKSLQDRMLNIIWKTQINPWLKIMLIDQFRVILQGFKCPIIINMYQLPIRNIANPWDNCNLVLSNKDRTYLEMLPTNNYKSKFKN